MEGVKHLIQCHCILPQYRKRSEPIFHKFVVFSVLDDSDSVISKIAKCNNCGATHRVYDLCKSEIALGKDESDISLSIKDLRLSLNQKICDVLDSFNVDVATWEEVLFIVLNQKWDHPVVLVKEEIEEIIHGKYLKILEDGNVMIYPFSIKKIVGED